MLVLWGDVARPRAWSSAACGCRSFEVALGNARSKVTVPRPIPSLSASSARHQTVAAPGFPGCRAVRVEPNWQPPVDQCHSGFYEAVAGPVDGPERSLVAVGEGSSTKAQGVYRSRLGLSRVVFGAALWKVKKKRTSAKYYLG